MQTEEWVDKRTARTRVLKLEAEDFIDEVFNTVLASAILSDDDIRITIEREGHEPFCWGTKDDE